MLKKGPQGIHLKPDFSLSPGCFGTDIIQNCTKWSNIGVHGLKIWPIFAKFQCASFLIRKNVKKWQYGRKKKHTCRFSWKKSLRSRMPHTKVVKNKKLDIIQLNLIKFNRIISKFSFFTKFGVRHAASQRFFFTKNDIFVFFWTMLSFFRIFSN